MGNRVRRWWGGVNCVAQQMQDQFAATLYSVGKFFEYCHICKLTDFFSNLCKVLDLIIKMPLRCDCILSSSFYSEFFKFTCKAFEKSIQFIQSLNMFYDYKRSYRQNFLVSEIYLVALLVDPGVLIKINCPLKVLEPPLLSWKKIYLLRKPGNDW